MFSPRSVMLDPHASKTRRPSWPSSGRGAAERGWLPEQLNKRFLDAGLQGEMAAHLSRDRHERGRNGNVPIDKRTEILIMTLDRGDCCGPRPRMAYSPRGPPSGKVASAG
jgi:hypothetical protein